MGPVFAPLGARRNGEAKKKSPSAFAARGFVAGNSSFFIFFVTAAALVDGKVFVDGLVHQLLDIFATVVRFSAQTVSRYALMVICSFSRLCFSCRRRRMGIGADGTASA